MDSIHGDPTTKELSRRKWMVLEDEANIVISYFKYVFLKKKTSPFTFYFYFVWNKS